MVCRRAPWAQNAPNGRIDGFHVPQVHDDLTVLETYTMATVQLLYFQQDVNAPGYPAHYFEPLHDEISNDILLKVGSYPKNIR